MKKNFVAIVLFVGLISFFIIPKVVANTSVPVELKISQLENVVNSLRSTVWEQGKKITYLEEENKKFEQIVSYQIEYIEAMKLRFNPFTVPENVGGGYGTDIYGESVFSDKAQFFNPVTFHAPVYVYDSESGKSLLLTDLLSVDLNE